MVSGWAIAVLAATVIKPILMLLYGHFVEPLVEHEGLTATVVVISVVSGFLSYLVGGYVAAKMAGYSGGKHGMLTAVFGLFIGITTIITLVSLGTVFVKDVTAPPAAFGFADVIPPASFGFASPALLAGSILFLTNLFGGFVGGKLGESSSPGVKRLG